MEGQLDEQALSGKVISGVTKIARKHNVLVIALYGGVELDCSRRKQLGLLAAFSIAPKPCSLEEALAETLQWLEDQTESFMRVIHHYKGVSRT